MSEKETLKRLATHMLNIAELNEVIRLKHEAIKLQSFEIACTLREEEKKLLAKLLTRDEIKELRDNLK